MTTTFTITHVATILNRITRAKSGGECLSIYREGVDLSEHIPPAIVAEMKRIADRPAEPKVKDVATALRDLIVNPTDRDTIIRAHEALEGTGVRLPE